MTREHFQFNSNGTISTPGGLCISAPPAVPSPHHDDDYAGIVDLQEHLASFLLMRCANVAAIPSIQSLSFGASSSSSSSSSSSLTCMLAAARICQRVDRGPYAWIGFAWVGCSQPYVRPKALDTDYGTYGSS